MAHKTHIEIVVSESDYYPYYMGWVKFFILHNENIIGAEPFKTQLIIHCQYKDGSVNSGRHLSPIYKTITFVQKDHREVATGYSIICFK